MCEPAICFPVLQQTDRYNFASEAIFDQQQQKKRKQQEEPKETSVKICGDGLLKVIAFGGSSNPEDESDSAFLAVRADDDEEEEKQKRFSRFHKEFGLRDDEQPFPKRRRNQEYSKLENGATGVKPRGPAASKQASVTRTHRRKMQITFPMLFQRASNTIGARNTKISFVKPNSHNISYEHIDASEISCTNNRIARLAENSEFVSEQRGRNEYAYGGDLRNRKRLALRNIGKQRNALLKMQAPAKLIYWEEDEED